VRRCCVTIRTAQVYGFRFSFMWRHVFRIYFTPGRLIMKGFDYSDANVGLTILVSSSSARAANLNRQRFGILPA